MLDLEPRETFFSWLWSWTAKQMLIYLFSIRLSTTCIFWNLVFWRMSEWHNIWSSELPIVSRAKKYCSIVLIWIMDSEIVTTLSNEPLICDPWLICGDEQQLYFCISHSPFTSNSLHKLEALCISLRFFNIIPMLYHLSAECRWPCFCTCLVMTKW